MALVVRVQVVVTLFVAMVVTSAVGHEDGGWIGKQGWKNRVGDFCCGARDCFAVAEADYVAGPGGYRLNFRGKIEVIPYEETMPFSIDGKLWVCRDYTGKRTCVFDRPPST
jgi:hypothetical protein